MPYTPANVSPSSKRLLGRYVSDPDFATTLHQEAVDPARFETWLVDGGFDGVDPDVVAYLLQSDQARTQDEVIARMTSGGGQVEFT